MKISVKQFDKIVDSLDDVPKAERKLIMKALRDADTREEFLDSIKQYVEDE